MKKFQFLCSNHRRWLRDRPAAAAANTWSQSYVRSLDLAEDKNYSAAITHAGAAFEIADIILDKQTSPSATNIQCFTDSAILLTQLLHRVEETQFAQVIVSSTHSRIDKLLVQGMEHRTALEAYTRLQAAQKILLAELSTKPNTDRSISSPQH